MKDDVTIQDVSSTRKYAALIGYLKSLRSVAVAFSGGRDSTLLLVAAQHALGDKVVAFTINTPYMAEWELDEARFLALQYSIQHHMFDMPVIESIQSNPPDRCYLCKYSLFSRLTEEAKNLGIEHLADGTNSDDLNSYRPGIKALNELNVVSPLLANQFTKQDIAAISKKLGLPNWNKSAYACLLSRLPYHRQIDIKLLRRIEASEKYLIEIGFKTVRVRVHDDLARIEVPEPDLAKLLEPNLLQQVEHTLREYGFKYVTIDARGYRSGCFDE